MAIGDGRYLRSYYEQKDRIMKAGRKPEKAIKQGNEWLSMNLKTIERIAKKKGKVIIPLEALNNTPICSELEGL